MGTFFLNTSEAASSNGMAALYFSGLAAVQPVCRQNGMRGYLSIDPATPDNAPLAYVVSVIYNFARSIACCILCSGVLCLCWLTHSENTNSFGVSLSQVAPALMVMFFGEEIPMSARLTPPVPLPVIGLSGTLAIIASS
jgi:hypothetical protein